MSSVPTSKSYRINDDQKKQSSGGDVSGVTVEMRDQSESLKRQEKSWQVDEEKASQLSKKKGFLARLVPESKKGKIVFAGSVAQLASMTIAPLAVVMFEKLAPKQMEALTNYLGGVFGRHYGAIEPVIKYTWENAMMPHEVTEWNCLGEQEKGLRFAAALLSSGLQIASNLSVTLGVRELMDNLLGIHAGGKVVLRSQLIDTAVALGSTLAIPAFLPKASRSARKSIEGVLDKSQALKWFAGDNAPKQYAFNLVNFTAPDMLGFATGIGYMLREVEKREQQEAEKKSQSPALTI